MDIVDSILKKLVKSLKQHPNHAHISIENGNCIYVALWLVVDFRGMRCFYDRNKQEYVPFNLSDPNIIETLKQAIKKDLDDLPSHQTC